MKALAGRRPSPALVISCIALFCALSGSAVALQGVNGVNSADIQNGAVRRADIANNAITGLKVANGSLSSADIRGGLPQGPRGPQGPPGPSTGAAGGDLTGTYPNPQVATSAIGTSKLLDGGVRAADVGPITTVSATTGTFNGGSAGQAFVQCPPGTRVISGGGAPTTPNGGNVYMTLSRMSSPNGWRYDAYNSNAPFATMTVFAYCLAA